MLGRTQKIGIFAIALLASSSAAAQNTDATKFLNDALSRKPAIRYASTRDLTVRECSPIGDLGAVAEPGEGGNGAIRDYGCRTRIKTETVLNEGAPKVTASNIIEVRNLRFDDGKLTALPEKAIIAEQQFQNCANVQMTNTINLALSATRGYSVAKTKTVTSTTGGSATLSGNWKQAIGGSVSYSFSKSVALSTQTTDSYSETISRGHTTTISVPPKTAGRLYLMVYEGAIDIPFSATVVVDGPLAPNRSGYSQASQLLSEKERTLPFEGVLTVKEVSNNLVRTESLPANVCAADQPAVLTTTESSTEVPAASLPDRVKKAFKPAKEAESQIKSALLNQAPFYSSLRAEKTGDPGIGPVQNGTHYQVLYTTQTTRPDPRCGFNDFGMMNSGMFNVEHREYFLYVNGNVVSRWMDEVETFQQCWTV